MSKDVYFPSYLAPLRFLEREDLTAWESCQEPGLGDAVLDFCCPGTGRSRSLLAHRYQEITSASHEPWVAPDEERTLARLFWPLRGAKVCHVLGYHLGTIALCGIVGEMVAILHFLTTRDEPGIALPKKSVSEFEDMPQGGPNGRITALDKAGLLSPEVRDALEGIRQARNRYLHGFQADQTGLADDALATYAWASTVVAGIVGQEISHGRVMLRPRFRRYLDRLGLLTDKAPDWTTSDT